MMRALVVFESMFGNTQAIADAIADGLSGHIPVEVLEVGVAPATIDDDVALVVVGAPTHAFGASRSAPGDGASRSGRRPATSGTSSADPDHR